MDKPIAVVIDQHIGSGIEIDILGQKAVSDRFNFKNGTKI